MRRASTGNFPEHVSLSRIALNVLGPNAVMSMGQGRIANRKLSAGARERHSPMCDKAARECGALIFRK
jgi:hypothetical protein